MPEAIPTLLAPYLQNALESTSLTLVTSTLSNPGNWLLPRLLYTALEGVDGASPGPDNRQSNNVRCKVIFVSLIRPRDLWQELAKKLGFDLLVLLKSNRLHYVDGLRSNYGNTQIAGHSPVLKPLTLDAIFSAIKAATSSSVSSVSDSGHASSRPTIIIDGLDFVLASSQPEIDAAQIQIFLSRMRAMANAVFLTSNADSPLLHNRHDSASPLERDHAAFTTSIAHQSSWVMQLRGLDTGTARDVTGVLRISKGGANAEGENQQAELEEREWLYQIKGDGSVRVWSRGE